MIADKIKFGALFALVFTLVFSSVIANPSFAQGNEYGAKDNLPFKQFTSGKNPQFVPNQLIIGFKNGVSADKINGFYKDFQSDYGLEEKQSLIEDNQGKPVTKLVRTWASIDNMIIEKLKNDPRVAFVEPDYIITIDTINTNDPYRNLLWGLDNTGQSVNGVVGTTDADIDAPEAWGVSSGSSNTIIGIIDTGVDYNHEDLTANIWTNPGEIANNGIDDDGNGYVDDIHGWNAITNTGNPLDDNGHGTHVAGTIGAVANNGKGIVGINQHVTIIACKFLDKNGSGATSDAVKCFDYFSKLKQTGTNVKVTNNSWGGGGFSSALYNAMNNGILHAVAAGNGGSDGVGDNNDISPSYPSSYDLSNVIAVAATDSNDQYAGFSNYGPTSVDIAAPGVNIASTWPGNQYAYASGTSMATPHVTGAAALAWSVNPSLTTSDVKNLILSNGDPLAGSKTVSNVRLNANKLLLAISSSPTPTPDFALSASPSTVSILQGNSGSSSVTVTSLNGFSNSVTLSLSGNPTGVGYSFSTNPVTPTASSTLALTVDSTVTPGTYSLPVTASDGTLTHTTTISLTVTQPSVNAPLSVSISTDKSTYTIRSFSYITVKTTDSSGPVVGASVTLKVTDPNGKTSQGSGTTDSTGKKVFKYKIGSVRGIYKADAQATATGHDLGSGSTTFTVK